MWKLVDIGFNIEGFNEYRIARRNSVSYLAPELFLDEPQYAPTTDLWALGCVLHELAFGRARFRGRQDVERYAHLARSSFHRVAPSSMENK